MQFARKSSINDRLINSKKYKFNFLNIFICLLIKNGLKKKAQIIVYDFICCLKKYFLKITKNFYSLFETTFEFYKPKLLIVYKKIASKIYSIPWYINENKARVLLVKWFIISAKKRIEKNLSLKLFFEFIDLYNGQGLTIKKLEDYYKVARENRAFIKFLRKRKKVFRSRLKKFSK